MEPTTFAAAAKFLAPVAITGIKKVQNWAQNTYGVRKILADFGWNVDRSRFRKIYIDAVNVFNDQLSEDPVYFGGEAQSILSLLKQRETEALFWQGFFGDITEQDLVDGVCAIAYSQQEKYGHILQLIPQQLDTLKVYFIYSLFTHMDPAERYTLSLINRIDERLTVQGQQMQQGLDSLKQQNAEGFESIRQLLLQLAPTHTVNVPEDTKLVSAEFDGEIDDIVQLLEQHKNKSAIDQLERYRARKWQKLTDDQKYKLLVNSGKANFELGNTEAAAACFIELTQYRQSDIAEGLAAMGYSYLEQYPEAEAAIDRALKIDPLCSQALTARISLMDAGVLKGDLSAHVPTEALKDPMVALAAAVMLQRYQHGSYHQEALQILEDVLNNIDPNSLSYFENLQMQANVITSEVHNSILKNASFLTDGMINALKHAIEIFDQVWDFYKETDLRETKWFVPANRGIAYRLLGRYEEAAKDFQRSIDVRPTFFAYRNLLYVEHLQGKRNFDLVAKARQLPNLSEEDKESLIYIEAQDLMDTDQTLQLVKLLQDHPAKEDVRTQATRAYLLATAYKKAGQIKQMLEVADGFLKKYGPELVILNLAAEATLNLYGKDRAEQYFDQMKATITDEDNLNDLLPALQLAKELNKSTWAAEQILQRRHPGEPTNFDDLLVVGLFNKQQYEQGIAIASELPRNEKTKHIHYFADTKALELEGNFEGLLDAADAMAVEFPDDDYPAAMHISGLIGLGDDATLAQWLFDYENRVGLARAFAALNLCGSICEDHVVEGIKDLALSLRNRNADNIEAHRHYVDFVNGLFEVKRWNERIQMVTRDCIVLLRRVETLKFVTISDNGTQGNAYHPESLEVRGIVGKFIGDACEFEGATHYIIDVGDTNVAAFVASREIVISKGL